MHSPMNEESEKDIIMKLSSILPPSASGAKAIRCADCGAKNSGQRKFCGKCGSNLWESCLQCGVSNPSHEEFCGNCGVHLPAALESKATEFEKHIEKAGKLLEFHRFQEAINLLKPIAASTHSRLAQSADWAKNLLLQCTKEQANWTAKIQKIEADIPPLVAAGNIDSALTQIREIPEFLRSPGLRGILEDLEKQQAEIADLNRTIFQPGDRPLTVELMDNVARLLALQPNHEAAAKLSLALKSSAMRQSKTWAQNGEYEKAWEILHRVPDAFQDEEYHAFREQIGDLAYLSWDIGHAPLADKALFEFARRLRKYLPEVSDLNALCIKLANRERNFQESTFADRRWWEHSPPPLFGAPMEFLLNFGTVRTEGCANSAALAENPGRFAVACGLALQGLGLAPLQINLLPEKTWYGKIGRWLPKRKARAAWGIEISASGIKAVKLLAEHHRGNGDSDGKPPTVSLGDCRIIEHRRRLMQSTNDKERDSLLEETLQIFLEQNPFENEPVILGLPDWMVLLKTVELPPMPRAKREAAITHEARHLFPALMRDMHWKYARVDAAEDEESQKRPFTVAYVGVRHLLLKELVSRWHQAGMRIAAVQCDMVALYNFAMFHGTAERTDAPTAYVDLGANRLNVLVGSPKRIWHRSVMFGSDQINKALVREFKLTYGQAEQWKRDPTLAPSTGKYYETLQSVYEVYVQEILDSLAAYHKAFPGDKVGRIVGCGGGLAAHDLPRYFLWRK